MDIGVHLPQLGRGATPSALKTFCAEAERLGVHSGWVSDHIAWPTDIESKYPYTPMTAASPPRTRWRGSTPSARCCSWRASPRR